MIKNPKKWFCYSAVVILIVTGGAKVWSAFGSAHILQSHDPILNLHFNQLMFGVGILELAIAGVCLFTKRETLSLFLIAWLGTGLFVYRLGLWWTGWQHPCPCLGNLTDTIHISPNVADNIMKIALAYLIAGSYVLLFRIWQQKKMIPF